jgi:hypothetical protein
MITIFGLSLIFSILMAVHVIKTGRELYWVLIILIFQPLGGIIYFAAIVLPELLGGSTARRVARTARETLDPTRAYREAATACEETPTVGNRMRLAQAAAALGRHEEAENLYREAMQGIHAEDPALMLGRAQALVELGRHDEALAILEALGEHGDKGRTPQAAIAMGRAFHALGRHAEAEDAFSWAAERMPGLEASARYAAFLADIGRMTEAQAILTDLDKRYAKTKAHFRKEARQWRDFAASHIHGRA